VLYRGILLGLCRPPDTLFVRPGVLSVADRGNKVSACKVQASACVSGVPFRQCATCDTFSELLPPVTVVHSVSKGKKPEPVRKLLHFAKRICGAAAEPTQRPGRLATQNNTLLPAIAQNPIHAMGAPYGQQINHTATINPNDILCMQMLGNVRHVRLVEQGKVTRCNVVSCKGSVKGINAGLLVTSASWTVSIGHDDTMLRDQFIEDLDRLSPV
jgi:hypothetical protein